MRREDDPVPLPVNSMPTILWGTMANLTQDTQAVLESLHSMGTWFTSELLPPSAADNELRYDMCESINQFFTALATSRWGDAIAQFQVKNNSAFSGNPLFAPIPS